MLLEVSRPWRTDAPATNEELLRGGVGFESGAEWWWHVEARSGRCSTERACVGLAYLLL